MLRRWSILLAMLAVTLGTALSAGPASAAPKPGGWQWPPPGTQNWNPGGVINRVGRTFSRTGSEAESTNWSGYAGTTGTYTSVSASWTQPKATCTSGDQYAAFWVGLDGYSSDTVEQTGSEVDCIGKTAEYYAWYEAYPAASSNYSNTVEAGDQFTATVTYEGSNVFALYIDDITEGWSHTTDVTVKGAARSSAEVIAEAPCCTVFGGILPLTDFGTVNFTGSMANGSALGNAGGLTEIIMVDNAGRDKDTVSSLTSGENFSCTWERSS
jgi:Peptidase A4 family